MTVAKQAAQEIVKMMDRCHGCYGHYAALCVLCNNSREQNETLLTKIIEKYLKGA